MKNKKYYIKLQKGDEKITLVEPKIMKINKTKFNKNKFQRPEELENIKETREQIEERWIDEALKSENAIDEYYRARQFGRHLYDDYKFLDGDKKAEFICSMQNHPALQILKKLNNLVVLAKTTRLDDDNIEKHEYMIETYEDSDLLIDEKEYIFLKMLWDQEWVKWDNPRKKKNGK